LAALALIAEVSTSQVIADVGSVVLGLLVIVFRRPVARFSVSMQNKTWGFKFDEDTVRFTERVAIPIVGALFIIGGLSFLALDL
jgi:hypothetical protein